MDRLTGPSTRPTLVELSMEEKVELLSGRDTWHTRPVSRLGIVAIRMSDGPNGVRGTDDNHGPTSTSFPVGAAMGASWDPALIEEVGRALGIEAVVRGVDVLLGPTVNIPRVPIGGRNFEAFSEDPFLSGTLAAAYVRGVQSRGVGACIKHFVCNDQEHDRYNLDVQVSERALREIYLEPFRIAVEQSGPWAVMSAYNTIDGVTASEHPLLDDVLRAEFGFDGLVISDWYGTYGPGVLGSGLDLEMPGPGRWMSPDAVRDALSEGRIDERDIDRKVGRLLTLSQRVASPDLAVADDEEHRSLSRRVASESMVLLKNDGLLPIDRPARIAVIGELASSTPFQGGGSSSVSPHRVVSVLEGIRQWAGQDVEVTWAAGCAVSRHAPLLDTAAVLDGGLLVEYFAGDQLEGAPVRTAKASRSFLSFFGEGDGWVDHQRFSLRLMGRFSARSSGVHEFEFRGAGRCRVWFDRVMVLDQWDGIPEDGVRSSLDLASGGQVEFVVEYASIPGDVWRWLAVGCREPGPSWSIEAAVETAAAADVAVVVAGLTPEYESEGSDRPDLRLPGGQDELIDAVAAAQPDTVVVVTSGSAVEMPWAGSVKSILQAWYGGQEVGHAVADVLAGLADPGGRLPVTFPVSADQHPGLDGYPGEDGALHYRDGIHVGYKGFDRGGVTPLFPFGHGLSYASLQLGSVVVSSNRDGVSLAAELSNVADRAGSDVIQVFAHDIGGVMRRLVGFQKVRLAAGESARVEIDIASDRLRWWDGDQQRWESASGDVELSMRSNGGDWAGKVALGS